MSILGCARCRHARRRLLFGAIALLTFGRFRSSFAHEDGTDPNAAWLRSLTVPGTGGGFGGSARSCCNGQDCRNVETRIRDGKLEAWVDDKTFPDTPKNSIFGHAPNDWVPIPEAAILRGQTNPTGRPLLCWFQSQVQCFVEGTQV